MNYDTIYVDMDGVLADYYRWFEDNTHKTRDFRELVFDYKIFSNLHLMPSAQAIIRMVTEYQYEWPKCKLEILSSGGSYKKDIFEEAVRQKNNWLDDRGILWDRKFTHCGESKAQYADPRALLIDDNGVNITNWRWNEGPALLWEDKAKFRFRLHNLLNPNEHLPIPSESDDECTAAL